MLHQRSMQRHAGAQAGWGSKQQQMLMRTTIANAVAVEGKRSTKKQLNFPFTRIQVGFDCYGCCWSAALPGVADASQPVDCEQTDPRA